MGKITEVKDGSQAKSALWDMHYGSSFSRAPGHELEIQSMCTIIELKKVVILHQIQNIFQTDFG